MRRNESDISEKRAQRRSSAGPGVVKFAAICEEVNIHVHITLAYASHLARLQAPETMQRAGSVASTCAVYHSTIILQDCAISLHAAVGPLHTVTSDLGDVCLISPTEISFFLQHTASDVSRITL